MMIKKISLVLAIGAFMTFSACGGKHNHSHENTENAAQEKTEVPAAEESGPEYTSAYICPMHCPGSGSDQPGQCPKCGMDYVKNEEVKTSETGHEGHNH